MPSTTGTGDVRGMRPVSPLHGAKHISEQSNVLTEAVLGMEGERKMMMEGQREHQSRPVFRVGRPECVGPSTSVHKTRND